MKQSELMLKVRQILFAQKYAVLATVDGAKPHTTIVSYIPADDLHSLIFPTPITTRKYHNLQANPWVSFFVDDRTQEEGALMGISGIEARGEAKVLKDQEREQYEYLYRSRFPNLSNFASKTALVKVEVQRYDVVFEFQNVYVLDLCASQEKGLESS